MAIRETVYPTDQSRHALYDANRYSPAIRSGDLLFVSGQVGSRSDGSPEPNFAAQVQLAFENLASVLRSAGCTFDDIVDVTAFYTDYKTQSEIVREVRYRVLGGPPYSNWTAIGVNWLAGFDFEIKVIARLPDA